MTYNLKFASPRFEPSWEVRRDLQICRQPARPQTASRHSRSGRIGFRRLTEGLVDRIEVIVRFLAVLELFKQGAVELTQAESFGEIGIEWIAGADFDPDDLSVDTYEG